MTALYQTLEWIYDRPWIAALRESEDAYPLLETAHVLAIAVTVGSVVIMDLRVLGVILRQEAVTRVGQAMLPLTWCGFGVMLLTGVPLFAAQALQVYANPAFRVKLLLLLLVGCNALLFHATAYRSVATWDHNVAAPIRARAFAVMSIALWSAIVVSGRLIAVFRVH